MIIVFEGPNCVGKTVYANKLSEVTGYPLINFGTTGNVIGITNEELDLKAKIEDGLFCKMTSSILMGNFIVDRLYPSDFVYSKIKKGRKSNVNWYIELEDKYKQAKNKLINIYIKCNDEVELLERRKENNEKFILESEILLEHQLYEVFFKRFTIIPYIEIDSTKRNDLDKNILLIINELKRIKRNV